MQYRKFGKLDLKVSALGFGAMRLPNLDNDRFSERVDEKESVNIIRYAIDHGVNYVDTAYGYHRGNSEIVVGKALRDGYREKVMLATKCPVWLVNKPDDFDTLLAEQLKKLQTDHIDFYLLHALDKQRWRDIVLKNGLLQKAEQAIKDGRICHLGFSVHDDFKGFKEIIDGYGKWTFCQIQYNYMDIDNQAGIKGVRYAASKGIAVIVMEPLLGGKLSNPPEKIKELYKEAKDVISPADLALQWVWDQPEVSMLLSGMTTIEQVKENLASAERSKAGILTIEQAALIDKIRKKYRELLPVQCTKCAYCMQCPQGVNIPRNIELYNDGFVHADFKTSKAIYNKLLSDKQRANACIQCRICEKKCPQKIMISELMPKIHEKMSEP